MSKPLSTRPPRGGWKCPSCRRSFTQLNQRHACGTGERSTVLRHRAPELVRLFESLEAFATSLGPIELVARDRYVLLRSVRIFADVVMMTDAVRVAVHLRRPVDDSLFFKVVTDGKKVTGVTKLQTQGQLQRLLPYIEEAYEASLH
jgi:hypothetical protein